MRPSVSDVWRLSGWSRGEVGVGGSAVAWLYVVVDRCVCSCVCSVCCLPLTAPWGLLIWMLAAHSILFSLLVGLQSPTFKHNTARASSYLQLPTHQHWVRTMGKQRGVKLPVCSGISTASTVIVYRKYRWGYVSHFTWSPISFASLLRQAEMID